LIIKLKIKQREYITAQNKMWTPYFGRPNGMLVFPLALLSTIILCSETEWCK